MRPMMFLFSAGPKGMRYLLRHMEAAEATGMTIITMDRFGNSHTAEAANRNLELKNDIEVGIIAFEGGHQVPPVEHQVMAFEWLLNSESVGALSTLDDLRPHTTYAFSVKLKSIADRAHRRHLRAIATI